MAAFSYVAVTAGNERVTGAVEAETAEAAARALQRSGVTLVSLKPSERRRTIRELLATEVSLGSRLPERTFVSLLREWATLVDAGLPLHRTLDLSARGRKGAIAALVRSLLESVRSGASFREALDGARIFPPAFVALVGAAEASGSLAATLKRAADEAEARLKLSQKLRKDLVYPAFLTVTASAAIVVLLTVVVPNIEALIEDAGAVRLPLTTRLVLAASHALRDYGLLVLALLVCAAVVAGLFVRTGPGRLAAARLALRLPLAGPLLQTTAVARYLGVLASLTAGGVGLARAQAHAAATVANAHVARRLAETEPMIAAGASLTTALEATGLVPDDALGLVRSGEQTGRLPEMLEAAGRLLGSRADQRVETLSALVGPALTIGFGLLAGLVVYAMLTTILSVNEFAFR